MIIHIIEPGDTIYSIANLYGVSPKWLVRENGIVDPNHLIVGASLVILYPKTTHIVAAGDTLESIASSYNITILDLLRYNSFLSDQEILIVGQELVIEYTDEKISELIITGYCFSFIDTDILMKTLPYLTYLIIHGYHIDENGTLIEIDDTGVIEYSKAHGVAPIMQVSLVDEDGINETNTAHYILNNTIIRMHIIDCIVNNFLTKGYAGISINPIYVLPSDRLLYIEFMTELANRVKELGLLVFDTLIPNTFELITDIFVSQNHLAVVNQLVDSSILFPINVGMRLGSPVGTPNYMLTRELIEYFLEFISNEKLSFGINTVGYMWELPYVAGVTQGNAISESSAYNLAIDYNIPILFDKGTQSAYFIYLEDNQERIVRFRDARSIVTYLNLVNEYCLAGVGIWNIMDFFNQLWLIINSQYYIYRIDD